MDAELDLFGSAVDLEQQHFREGQEEGRRLAGRGVAGSESTAAKPCRNPCKGA